MTHLPPVSHGLTILWLFATASLLQAGEHDDFFERQIRPLLANHCLECHGAGEQSAGLRLDSAAALQQGGESGPVIVPGNPDASRLIQAVRGNDDELSMPPETPLSEQQIQALEHWVKIGAPWPTHGRTIADPRSTAAASHWAFQPVRSVPPPQPTEVNRIRTPVDAFVLQQLQHRQLTLSRPADPRSLIRRTTMTLTGLPPAAQDVDTFVRDFSPETMQQLIDQLLNSPAYGQHWARHWLDIARYSDTKGYVYAREERHWTHAWSYRDWVVDALNSDMAYDRFLLLQLAADQVADRTPQDLAAMGFLTVGRRFLGVTRDIMDDRIDTIGRGTMGLTVACARCHDHKYDPIPTSDYYSLYGILNSCREELVALPDSPEPTDEWQNELKKRQQKFDETFAGRRKTASDRARTRLDEYLRVQAHMDTVPVQGFDQILLEDDLIPGLARRWEDYLRQPERHTDAVFVAWKRFAALPVEQFQSRAPAVLAELKQLPPEQFNPRLAAAFSSPPTSFDDVINIYVQVLTQIRDTWEQKQAAAQQTKQPAPQQLTDSADEQLRQVMYGALSPCEIPDEGIVTTEDLFTSSVCTELWKLQGEIDRWINTAPHQPRYALTLIDRDAPIEARVFRRGNPKTPGDDVDRHFLTAFSSSGTEPFQQGSGRLELAQSIIDPANPLTARVIVNRVWAWHFGTGLVSTPSDFGLRAAAPSHPDLLDWLTQDFIDHGWSLKHLHRRILLSATWQQSSQDPDNPSTLAHARKHDPSNRLLWKMPLHRLTFEEFRDSILAVTEELDQSAGGRPQSLLEEAEHPRRSIYGEIDRQFFPTALRVFDVANPDIHIPRRAETTVPQQTLFYLNHSLVQNRARRLATFTARTTDPAERVQQLFRRILQRVPTDNETTDALALIAAVEESPPVQRPQTKDWSYLVGRYDEQQHKTVDTTVLPHFTGAAWQGSDKYPDNKLGWVQLTATGGHPGNDRNHASIRRWTAPAKMTVQIRSTLKHEPQPGDGIRAFVVSSQAGQLASAAAHQQKVGLNIDSISVTAGETLDFVVDIKDVLNSDQYLWEITITSDSNGAHGPWNSRDDFSGPGTEPLGPWEQLAQILLCSNEFLFVD